MNKLLNQSIKKVKSLIEATKKDTAKNHLDIKLLEEEILIIRNEIIAKRKVVEINENGLTSFNKALLSLSSKQIK